MTVLKARIGGVWVPLTAGLDQSVADGRYVFKAGDTMTGPLRMPTGANADATSIAHSLQVGVDSSTNVRFDDRKIVAVNNGAYSTLYLLGNPILVRDSITQLAGHATAGVQFDQVTGTKIAMYGNSYQLGVQTNTLYARSPSSFAWYIGGAHSDTAGDPGAGGANAMFMGAQGWLYISPSKTANDIRTVGIELQGSNGVIASTSIAANIINHWCNHESAANAAGQKYATYRAAGTEIGSISQASASAIAFNTTSDRRLKRLIGVVEAPAERVKRLKVWHFAWKVDDTEQDGFVADEVAEVVPDAVTGERDAVDEAGDIVPQQLDHSKLVPLLTAALQDALARIEVLERRVDELTAA